MTLEMLRSIVTQFVETYNDPKTYPENEYPDLWIQLREAKKFLGWPYGV